MNIQQGKFLIIGLILMLPGLPFRTEAGEKLPVYESLGTEFTMESTVGEPLSLSRFQGRLVLIYFGYTSCPDICPTTLTVIKHAVQELRDSGEKVQVLFISVDPERDNVKQMKSYLEFFDPGFIGLWGKLDQVQKVAKKFGAFFIKNAETQSAVGYLMSHTGYVYLIDRQSRVRKLFSSKVDAEEIVETIRLLPDA